MIYFTESLTTANKHGHYTLQIPTTTCTPTLSHQPFDYVHLCLIMYVWFAHFISTLLSVPHCEEYALFLWSVITKPVYK